MEIDYPFTRFSYGFRRSKEIDVQSQTTFNLKPGKRLSCMPAITLSI